MSKKTNSKKTLSSEQREELLLALEVRFEKNMKRHKGLDWAKVQAKLVANHVKNCGRLMKWKQPAANQMLSVMIKRRVNIFFTIVQRKVLKAAEVFVTTVKRWIQGKNINRKIARWIWQPPWALSF